MHVFKAALTAVLPTYTSSYTREIKCLQWTVPIDMVSVTCVQLVYQGDKNVVRADHEAKIKYLLNLGRK